MRPVVYALVQLISIYQTLIFIYVLLSWFMSVGGSTVATIYRLLGTICEPWVGLFRRVLPLSAGGLDFSPMVALLALYVIERALIFLL